MTERPTIMDGPDVVHARVLSMASEMLAEGMHEDVKSMLIEVLLHVNRVLDEQDNYKRKLEESGVHKVQSVMLPERRDSDFRPDYEDPRSDNPTDFSKP